MTTQMTLRQIPDPVAKGLRLRARKTGRSLNRATVDLLGQALGLGEKATKRRDLTPFAGCWDRQTCLEFAKFTRGFERISSTFPG